MLAKDQHVMKYSKLYLDKGINVLKIKISLFDLLLPTRGTQVWIYFFFKSNIYEAMTIYTFLELMGVIL